MDKKDYGTVEYEGKELALQQDAYIDGDIDHPHYTAIAADADGNEYRVVWQIQEWYLAAMRAESEEANDQMDACDWAVYDITPL